MPSSDVETMLYMLKGILSDLPEEDKKKLDDATHAIRSVIDVHGDIGSMAAFLVAVEFIAKL